jgi:hypothetical protein
MAEAETAPSACILNQSGTLPIALGIPPNLRPIESLSRVAYFVEDQSQDSQTDRRGLPNLWEGFHDQEIRKVHSPARVPASAFRRSELRIHRNRRGQDGQANAAGSASRIPSAASLRS